MNHTLRYLFFALVVRPVALVVIGLNLRRRELLPRKGPALVVANHNSHLDALVLISLFPLRDLRRVRPVAAADTFCNGGWSEWFARQIIGIIPLDRKLKDRHTDPLRGVVEALEQENIVILFPEGTRGEPEQLCEFKTGVAHVAKRFPEAPVTPVYIHGLGKALPRGEALLVPFFCDVYVGEPIHWTGDRTAFMDQLQERMSALAEELGRPAWV